MEGAVIVAGARRSESAPSEVARRERLRQPVSSGRRNISLSGLPTVCDGTASCMRVECTCMLDEVCLRCQCFQLRGHADEVFVLQTGGHNATSSTS
jgi:hypothetical protein